MQTEKRLVQRIFSQVFEDDSLEKNEEMFSILFKNGSVVSVVFKVNFI